ncbi:TPA: hypothetical protein ACX6G2_001256, partial [Vibrio cholerae]
NCLSASNKNAQQRLLKYAHIVKSIRQQEADTEQERPKDWSSSGRRFRLFRMNGRQGEQRTLAGRLITRMVINGELMDNLMD